MVRFGHYSMAPFSQHDVFYESETCIYAKLAANVCSKFHNISVHIEINFTTFPVCFAVKIEMSSHLASIAIATETNTTERGKHDRQLYAIHARLKCEFALPKLTKLQTCDIAACRMYAIVPSNHDTNYVLICMPFSKMVTIVTGWKYLLNSSSGNKPVK